jgi:hypothetical protein
MQFVIHLIYANHDLKKGSLVVELSLVQKYFHILSLSIGLKHLRLRTKHNEESISM